MNFTDLPDIDEDFDAVRLDSHIGGTRIGELQPAVRHWLWRLLDTLDDDRLDGRGERPGDADLFIAAGLRKPEEYRARRNRWRKGVLRIRLGKYLAEAGVGPATLPAALHENVERVGQLAGLSQVDRAILAFAVLLHTDAALGKVVPWLDELNSTQVFQLVAHVLRLPETRVREALGSRGALARSGLVKLDRAESQYLTGKLEVLSDDFALDMLQADIAPFDLLRGLLAEAAPPQLGLADYEHIAPSLAILRPYLDKALSSGRTGANVLIYGAPGTGKSQLARVMARELGSELYEIACENAEGEPIGGEQRLRALGAAQCFLAQKHALVVFDEVEDVFDDGGGLFGSKSTGQTRKAWVNRMLESNALPTFWLTNAVEGLDPAFVRRFDQVLELRVPPRRQRERIVRNVSDGMLDEAAVARVAESEVLAPAVIARAAAVVSSIRSELGDAGVAPAIEQLVNQTLQAQGHPRLRAPGHARLDAYDPTLACADADLDAVAQGLLRARAGRLCLYGPPGTGKTAYGRWLAERLELPLHVKRAFDLLSMWVGGSEQAIAGAFTAAREDGAVLLIDEVDSFLQDRRGARQSWEATLVNEMLTQMESFPGVFVASTNLMDGFDPAALRRFDLKLRFDYLKPEQAWRMLQSYCEMMGLPAPTDEVKPRLSRLDRLTPGDFALVARQHGFRPLESVVEMVEALGVECKFKGGSTPIGFVNR